jgi:hypothetical protein
LAAFKRLHGLRLLAATENMPNWDAIGKLTTEWIPLKFFAKFKAKFFLKKLGTTNWRRNGSALRFALRKENTLNGTSIVQ